MSGLKNLLKNKGNLIDTKAIVSGLVKFEQVVYSLETK